MTLALTVDDLPAGFVGMPIEEIVDWRRAWPEGTYLFAMSDVKRSQVVMGVLIPHPGRADQLEFDATLPQFVQYMAALVGGRDPQKLDGLDDIGDARAAITSVSRPSSISFRWDIVGFRRGEVAALLIVAYPDGDQPAATVADLARLLEARMNQSHALQVMRLGPK